jgi:glucoamylase
MRRSVGLGALAISWLCSSADDPVDNLLWEISKFCIPVGAFLYLSIYLIYRHELYSWFSRSSLSPSIPATFKTPAQAVSAATVDAPAPSAGESADSDRFDKWVKKEEKVAWAAMAANIGPEAGAADGVVVAASSKGEWEDEPDYHVS